MEKFSSGNCVREYVFARNTSVQVSKVDQKTITVSGMMIDTYHEIGVRLTIDMEEKVILAANGEFIRAPFQECFDNGDALFQKLVGICVGPGVYGRIMKVIGWSDGCTHLSNLILDCVRGMIESPMTFYPHNSSYSETENRQFGTCKIMREKRQQGR